MKDFTLVRNHNEDGEAIDSIEKKLNESETTVIKQKYGMLYLFKIIYFLREILSEIEYKGNLFPYLREYFTIFNQNNLEYVKSKKTWNPLPPYKF